MSTTEAKKKTRPSTEVVSYMIGWRTGASGQPVNTVTIATRCLDHYLQGHKDGLRARAIQWAAAKATYPYEETNSHAGN